MAAPNGKGIAMDRAAQLQEQDAAYAAFVRLIRSLRPEQFLRRQGGWAPRDVVAHLIGWNRNIRLGCDDIRLGRAPFYHADAPNDYREFNAGYTERWNSTDAEILLRELDDASRALREYFDATSEADWAHDFGAVHYRGGPATIGRCAESITREYIEHGKEIAAGLQRDASQPAGGSQD